MHGLGKPMLPRCADHVGTPLVPGSVLDLGDQRLDTSTVDIGAEVQADGVEEPAPRAQVRQQRDRTRRSASGALFNEVAHRLIQRHRRVAQEVCSPEPHRRGVATGPQRVPPGHRVDLRQVEQGHGHVVGELVGGARPEATVVQRAFIDGTPQSRATGRRHFTNRRQERRHSVTPSARHVSTALRTPSSWNPFPQ